MYHGTQNLPINRAEGPPVPITEVGTGATSIVRRLVLDKSLVGTLLEIGGGSGGATLGEDALLGRLGGGDGGGLLLDLVLDDGLDLGDGLLLLLLGNESLLLLIGLVIR